ncbi:hypothetical protein GQ600_866 [Phytophthora cactorum]|nr:hypothetical protein GQ600_866 [Phytophthora cactorum]
MESGARCAARKKMRSVRIAESVATLRACVVARTDSQAAMDLVAKGIVAIAAIWSRFTSRLPLNRLTLFKQNRTCKHSLWYYGYYQSLSIEALESSLGSVSALDGSNVRDLELTVASDQQVVAL